MKKFFVLIMLSKAVFCGDYEETNSSWWDYCPSQSQVTAVVLALLAGQANGQNISDNCTDSCYPPYTLTDGQTEAYAWWQIGTGIFACVMIINNFVAPGFYWKRTEQHRADILTAQIEDIQRDIDRIKKNNVFAANVKKQLLQIWAARMAMAERTPEEL